MNCEKSGDFGWHTAALYAKLLKPSNMLNRDAYIVLETNVYSFELSEH